MPNRHYRIAAIIAVACVCLLLIQACDLSQPAANSTTSAGAAGPAGAGVDISQPPM